MLCLVTQSCLTLCDSMDCSPPGSSVHGDSPGKNTGVGCQALLHGIFFPTQGSSPGLPHCKWILYHLIYHLIYPEPPGKSMNIKLSLFGIFIFPTQGLNPGLPHFRQILYYLSHQRSPNSKTFSSD